MDGPSLSSTVSQLPLPEGKLTLANCIDRAIALHPDLRIAAAQVESARGTLVQAGLYPNPVVGYGADDVNSPGGGAGKQGVSVTQTIVTGNKLALASEAAARGLEAADLRTRTQYFDLIARTRTAFYEVLAARQEVEVARDILRIAQTGQETAEKLRRAGTVGQPDVLRAQVEFEQSSIRLGQAQQRAEAAWRLLATALGQPDLPSRQLIGSLTESVPDYDLQQLRQAMFEVSSELRAAQVAARQAEVTLARAEAEVVPNVDVQVRPFYSQPDRRAELIYSISAPLPIFNRNQGNILAARGGIAQAQAAVQQLELQLNDRLTLAFQRYQNARQQVEKYNKKILPAAQESLRLVSIAYTQGDARYEYTALLDAQRSLAQAKLGLVQALGDLHKAVSDIDGLLQREPVGKSPSQP